QDNNFQNFQLSQETFDPMRSSIKLLLFSLSLTLLALASPAWAQEKKPQQAPDAVKLSVGFTNSEYSNLVQTEYTQGLSAELDARMFKRAGVRLGGVFQYNRANLGDQVALDTYSFGPQLSVDLVKGYVSPFGRALFGLQTTYNADRTFARTYGLGVDVNIGHVFITPILLDWQKTEGVPGAMEE